MTLREAVDDIINRNVIELRKSAFGDDSEDAKSLAWTRAQAWKIVSSLAEAGEVSPAREARGYFLFAKTKHIGSPFDPFWRQISYAALLQDYPFKGAESALKALEAHDLVQVSYVDGRPSMVRPGKPVFRHAFGKLVQGESAKMEMNAVGIAYDLDAFDALVPFSIHPPSSHTPFRPFPLCSCRPGLPSDLLDRIHRSTHLQSGHGYSCIGSRAVAIGRNRDDPHVDTGSVCSSKSSSPKLAWFNHHVPMATRLWLVR